MCAQPTLLSPFWLAGSACSVTSLLFPSFSLSLCVLVLCVARSSLTASFLFFSFNSKARNTLLWKED